MSQGLTRIESVTRLDRVSDSSGSNQGLARKNV